jgi:NADP-dependent 3-hydroxy acid dehydrogenase YdfG
MVAPMTASEPLNVVITGASSGLGEALAHCYAERRARVALFARRRERLDEVAAACRARGAADARVVVGDTTDPAQVSAAVTELAAAWGRLDRAFLNAGGSGDRFKSKREEHFLQCCAGDDLTAFNFAAASAEWIVRVNYLGVVYWMEPLLRLMRAQRSGTIAVTGSLAADGNLPRSGPYTASKMALRALLDGLHHDARKLGVRLSLIECGWFISELTDAKAKAPFVMTAAQAARRAIRGVEAGKRVIRFPFRMALLSRLGTFVPRPWRDRFWDRLLPRLGGG